MNKQIYKKSFLKWAGGKFKILHELLPILQTEDTNIYIEPFAGSAVVFLNLYYENNIISDSNKDLINIYLQIQKNYQIFKKELKKIFNEKHNNKIEYNYLRNIFNTSNDVLEKSVLFIYLNRHCFNGLCRYNSKGIFNVPFGKYNTIYFPKLEMDNFHKHISERNCIFTTNEYQKTLSEDNCNNSIIYCDPPYFQLSESSCFTSYDGKNFSNEDQKKLYYHLKNIKKISKKIILSNHKTIESDSLYNNEIIKEIEVQRNISSKGTHRNKVKEIIVSIK